MASKDAKIQRLRARVRSELERDDPAAGLLLGILDLLADELPDRSTEPMWRGDRRRS